MALDYYHIDESLEDLSNKELILKTAIDIQALLQLLVKNNVITKEDMDYQRKVVASNGKYKASIDYIQQNKEMFHRAKENPQEYLQALLKAKMNGEIK